MKIFEYKTISYPKDAGDTESYGPLNDGELNELGKEGWELVSHTALMGWYTYQNKIRQYYVFKRLKKYSVNDQIRDEINDNVKTIFP